MAKWWKFGLGKGKDREEGPRPEPTPAPAPRPEPTPAPAEEGGKKRGGLLGRLFGRGKKKEAPAAPPEAPSAPAAPSAPSAPSAPAEEEGPAEAPGEEGEEGGGGVGERPERVYPPFLHVSADGDWVISDTEWSGTMSGTLHGSDVKTFIDAMEAKGGPQYDVAIPLIADAYGIPGGLIDIGRSTIHSVDY
ncbi:PE-PGRS family protein [Streptomyces sp. e14]|uniref:PE-PGRS family protein n=1 Tax=Streptomyces sp. e14 TaxID=645465 RepID=UPI0001D06D90|nr:PE-PGRS family protein [Streptomyces sp. e14]EFF88171.1 PE-PGRS family protein [Streptomyces sp. e14]